MKILDTQVSVSIIPQASKQASKQSGAVCLQAERTFFILRVLCLSVFNLIDMVCYGGMSTAVKADLTGNTIYK